MTENWKKEESNLSKLLTICSGLNSMHNLLVNATVEIKHTDEEGKPLPSTFEIKNRMHEDVKLLVLEAEAMGLSVERYKQNGYAVSNNSKVLATVWAEGPDEDTMKITSETTEFWNYLHELAKQLDQKF